MKITSLVILDKEFKCSKLTTEYINFIYFLLLRKNLNKEYQE